MELYRVDGTVILWIEIYLLDRKQATEFLGKKCLSLHI